MELRLLTDVDSSHFPLARHTSLQIYKHTHTDSCTTVASSIHTIHPPQWPGEAYTMLEHIFTPQQFTLGLWQLIVYATVALQGHHSLSVCPSVCPSVSLSICLSCLSASGATELRLWEMIQPEMESKVMLGQSSTVVVVFFLEGWN